MTRPEVSQAAEMLYGRLWPHTLEDEKNEWHLLRFCEMLAGRLFEKVRKYVADRTEFEWTPVVTAGIKQIGPDSFEKNSGGEGVGQVYSSEGFSDNCSLSFVPLQNNKGFGFGLNTDPELDSQYTSIDYFLNPNSAGTLIIRENGKEVGNFGAYKAGDVLAITYDGTTIKYLKNGTVLREVARAKGGALYADSWWNHLEGKVSNVQFQPLVLGYLSELPGWAVLFNVNLCPPEALAYLAQFVGVKLDANLTVAQQREKIKGRPAFKRGTPGAIESAAKTHLTGARFVFMQERHEGKAYRLLIRTFTAQTPNAARTKSDILAQKPAGIVLDYEAVVMKVYQEILVEDVTYTGLLAKGTYAEAVAEP